MKDRLTSADKPGWYLFRFTPQAQHDEAGYWDGKNLLSFPGAEDDTIDGCSNFRRLAEVAEPEVIEGRGQAVTTELAGEYLREEPSGKVYLTRMTAETGCVFHAGYRYMRCPAFPPRPPAPPPKPELVLVWMYDSSKPVWAVDCGTYVTFLNGRMEKSACWKVEKQA